jgi:hypothetical protein
LINCGASRSAETAYDRVQLIAHYFVSLDADVIPSGQIAGAGVAMTSLLSESCERKGSIRFYLFIALV